MRQREAQKLAQTEPLVVQIRVDGPVAIVADCPDYNVAEMKAMRGRLNATKTKIDKYHANRELASQWGRISGVLDLYRDLRRTVAERYSAQNVTNAWLKYWEIMRHFDIGRGLERFRSNWIAELPGGGLCATNQFEIAVRGVRMEWLASSLMPTPTGDSRRDTTALGDQYGLYRHNRDRWLMGLEPNDAGYTNDGDATDIRNLEDFERRVEAAFGDGADLCSHDAGIDASIDYNRQEELNARLHLGCALGSLMCLASGGTFIAKQYTCFATHTWNLILVYAGMFDRFYLMKPLTSRPGNSEMYLIGTGFRGMSPEVRSALSSLLTTLDNDRLRALVPQDAVKVRYADAFAAILDFATRTTDITVDYIEESLGAFERYRSRPRDAERWVADAKRHATDAWLRKFDVKKISRSDWIASDETAHA